MEEPKASCWSSVVKKEAPPPQQPPPLLQTQQVLEDARNRHGISVAVVDANAVIEAGEKLHGIADKFVSVPEVMEEIRDPVSRHKLSFLPFDIQTMEPTPESINKVVKFARVTGDLQTLSDVDIKLIALTYTLEAQIHGTKHLRDSPPPVQTVNVKRLPEKDMPGWGLNVPNLEEWEALEQETEDNANSDSRILPLQDLSLNILPQDDQSEVGSVEHTAETLPEIPESDERGGSMRRKNYIPKKKVINIEGKMVADGIDASQGQVDDNGGDWMPAVSRSTHRRFLRRKARREHYDALSSNQDQQDMEENIDGSVCEDDKTSNLDVHQSDDEKHIENVVSKDDMIHAENNDGETLSATLKQITLEEGSLEVLNEEHKPSLSPEDSSANLAAKSCETDSVNDIVNHSDIASQSSEAADVSYADDASEQSWMLRSLSESTVACITGDFAMQNVLLQMGLRLLAPGGSQIHQLHRWILKCHACFTVTADIGRIFCPKCGNGGTLRKVAVTVNENGLMMAARRPRVTLRGTRFSLPLPQGGRDAVTKNVILREDQLPQRVLHPKTRKKANKDDDFYMVDNVFSHHNSKGSPFQGSLFFGFCFISFIIHRNGIREVHKKMTQCSYPENNHSTILMERRKDSLIRTCPTCGHHIKCQDQGAGIHELPGLPAGVKFDPTDQEILEHLEAKVRSDIQMLHPLIDEFIPTLEGENGICCTHPEKLPGVGKDGLIRHFFHRPSKAYTTGTRKRRKVHTDADGSETRWHKTGKTRPVFVSGKLKGYKKILVLYTNYRKQRKPEKTNWVMHQYHLGNNEEEKEGELVVSKVFYQTQPRQCGGSLMKDSASFSDKKLNGDQGVNHEVVNHKNSGFVEYYSTSFISFDQGEQHRSNNAQVISHFPVHDGTSFIP